VRLTGRRSRGKPKGFPKEIHRRVLVVVKKLEKWRIVSGVKRLKGKLAGWYRAKPAITASCFLREGRYGHWDKIGDRKDVYED